MLVLTIFPNVLIASLEELIWGSPYSLLTGILSTQGVWVFPSYDGLSRKVWLSTVDKRAAVGSPLQSRAAVFWAHPAHSTVLVYLALLEQNA